MLMRHNAPQLHLCPLTSLLFPHAIYPNFRYGLILRLPYFHLSPLMEARQPMRPPMCHSSTQSEDIPFSYCHMPYVLVLSPVTPDTLQVRCHLPPTNHHCVLLRIPTLSNSRHLWHTLSVGFLLEIKHTYTEENFEISHFSNPTRDPCDMII